MVTDEEKAGHWDRIGDSETQAGIGERQVFRSKKVQVRGMPLTRKAVLGIAVALTCVPASFSANSNEKAPRI